MRDVHVNFREKDESEYGWEYLQPYFENNPKKPVYFILEIFREHELYKGIATNILSIQESVEKNIKKRLEKIQNEVHYSLLRTGDAEKNVRTLLHCWNSFFFLNDVPESKYFGLGEGITPIMTRAINETNAYYKELAAKKRSKAEMSLPKKSEKEIVTKYVEPEKHAVNLNKEEQPKAKSFTEDGMDVSSLFAD